MRIAAHHRRIVTALAALALLAVPVARAASAASYITVTISGTVRDGTTGTGVGGMCVYGTEEGYEGSTGPFVTAADGTYTWTSRAVQGAHFSYVLFAQPGCGASNWQTAYHSPPIELTAEPGQSAATGVDITTYRSGRIHGRITDLRTGKPLALALVFAVPVVKGPQAVDGETDAAGRFALDGVAAGTEKLIVDNVPGYLDGWAYREPTEPLATPYTVNVGQDVTVNDSPPRANTITGRVFTPPVFSSGWLIISASVLIFCLGETPRNFATCSIVFCPGVATSSGPELPGKSSTAGSFEVAFSKFAA